MKRVLPYLPMVATLVAGVFLLADPVSAQSANALEALKLQIDFTNNTDNIFTLIANVISFVLLIGGLLAFFYALLGGFTYLTAGGDTGKADNGRKIIVNAIIGIIVIFLSYSIIRFVVSRVATVNRNPLGTRFNDGQ